MNGFEHTAAELDASYGADLVAWADRQAALLRTGELGQADIEHIAEEIEDLGNSSRLALASHIRNVLVHLMKLQASPAKQPRAGCLESIDNARAEIEAILERSPSLRREVPAVVEKELRRSRLLAGRAMARYGEDAGKLGAPSYTADQVIGDWLPD